jgi:hypothetical protein
MLMSLACYECERVGYFDHILLFIKDELDVNKSMGDYPNFCVHDHHMIGIDKVEKSQFLLCIQCEKEGMWFTGKDPDKIKNTDYVFISEEWVKEHLPKMYKFFMEKSNNT